MSRLRERLCSLISFPLADMRTVPPRIGTLFGLVAIASFLVLYSIAAFSDPEYTFGENYLSDLGVGEAAWAFNSALILCGAFFLAFAAFGIGPVLGTDVFSRVAFALLVLCAVFLINIGIFTEDYGDLHGFFSYAFFLTFLATLGVLTATLYRSKALGRAGLGVTAATFVFGMMLASFGTGPMVETVAVFALVVWGSAICALILTMQVSRT